MKHGHWAATSLCPAVVSNQRVGEGEGGDGGPVQWWTSGGAEE